MGGVFFVCVDLWSVLRPDRTDRAENICGSFCAFFRQSSSLYHGADDRGGIKQYGRKSAAEDL